MAKDQVRKMLQETSALFMQTIAELDKVSNEQLDQRVKLFSREVPRRNAAYDLGNHLREHSIHVQKLLEKVGAQGASQTEAQRIIRENSMALGAFIAAFSLVNDEDLDKEFENQTPRKIIEHIRIGMQTQLGAITSAPVTPAPTA